jgi:ElaB/YqjD/DUF883 family membrane-anchored ribosome-binding protein
MNEQSEVKEKASQLVDDARELLAATADMADEKIVAARKRLSAALESGCDFMDGLQDKAKAGLKTADEAIREHPYHAVGIALGVGALVGFLMRRRD